MNSAYQSIISASDDDRRGLFLASATRLGTTIQNIEKDFWVCWTLDALFTKLKPGGPRLLFKGGTSLSKAYDLISRFSEDIDVTVFREDIGHTDSLEQLKAFSGNKRRERLAAIKAGCQAYINGRLREELGNYARQTMEAANKAPDTLQVVADPDDKDQQSLLIRYPSVVGESGYVLPSVKIESGAKSALDPNTKKLILPYLATDFRQGSDLGIEGVTTIHAERTFLDKILILHGLTFHFDAKGELRGNGRMSRHYYDVHRLMTANVGAAACEDEPLIADCVEHARIFFNRKDSGLEYAHRGSFRLVPTGAMRDAVAADYSAMSTMIFGDKPTLASVLESVVRAEELLNRAVK